MDMLFVFLFTDFWGCVTALSTQLPRPVFRMYPADLGEAAAVERSVGHALVVVEHARVKLGVNQPVMPPHADQQSANECDCQPAQYRGEVEDIFQHGSPHGLHQPCQNAEVDDEQQAGAEGYAVKQHLRLRVVWQGLL